MPLLVPLHTASPKEGRSRSRTSAAHGPPPACSLHLRDCGPPESMEGHHNAHAANAVHQQSSHNLDGVPNGLNWINYQDYSVDQSNNGFDSNWAYTQPDNAATSTSQSMPLYHNWQQSTATDPMLDPYGRQFSRSPAAQPQPQSYQTSFNGPRQIQTSSVYDPALTSSTFHNTQHLYPNATTYQPPAQTNATIAPNALENAAQRTITPQRSFATQPPVDQRAVMAVVPAAIEDGHFTVVDYGAMCKATNSTRMCGFVNVGQQDFEYPINKAVVPAAPARRSRNELRKLAAEDPKLLAKLGKKILKKGTGVPKVKKELKLQAPITKLVQTPTGVKTEVVSSSDDSDSETDSSDYDSDDEPDEPSPLPAKRPDEDLKEGIRYDTIKALWRPKRRVLPTASIKAGLKDYWEIVRTIRDRWKADSNAVKEAGEKGRNSELPLLKSRVKDQRDMMAIALKAAVEHGHRSILELSSENSPFMFVCFQFLQDRLLNDDTDGPLARSILEILAMCITLTEEKATKVHLQKMWPRYMKKGNEETKVLVKKVETAIKDATKQAAEEESSKKVDKDTKPQSPTAMKTAPISKPAADTVVGVKRGLPAGSTSGQPAKRVASGGSSVTEKAEAAKPIAAVRKTLPAAGATIKIASAAPTPAVKTKMTTSKPSSFFNAMQSTTKKPAAASKPAASSVLATALKGIDKKPTVAAATKSEPKSAFSFSSTMANLAKPKDKAPSPKPEQESTPETAEQKKKRLRKEARRGLRVTFKPESTIEEVRYFTHDPDEELGHDSSMTRDVSDVGGEGRMFKQHKDMMDVDEEEETVGEEDLKPWQEPKEIDFGDVDQEERNRNYAPFAGGQMQVDSPEKIAREHHEANTLMVFYTDRNDIPPTPKEPTEDVEMGDASNVKQFGTPSPTTVDRAQKLSSSSGPSQGGHNGQNGTTSAAPDLASILAALQPQPQAQQAAPQQAAPQLDLQSFLAQLGGQQQAPTQSAPAPPQTQQSVPSDIATIIAGIPSLQQSQQPQQSQQQYAPPPPPVQNPADLAALFAKLQQNPGAAPPAPPNFPGFGNGFPQPIPGFPPFPILQQQGQQQTQQQAYPFENEERRRWREQQGGQEDRQWNQNQSQNQNQNQNQNKKKGGADRRYTQPCKFWTQGKCQKGDKCTYRHD